MREYTLHLAHQRNVLLSPGLLTRLWGNWKARQAITPLLNYDEHMLRDIGVTRASVNDAIKASPWKFLISRLEAIGIGKAARSMNSGSSGGLIDPHLMSEHFQRDIGWLDGHATPGHSKQM